MDTGTHGTPPSISLFPKHKLWLLIAAAATAVIFAGLITFMSLRSRDAGTSGTTTVENLQESLDATIQAETDIPTANPLDRVAPSETPYEKTNPFNEKYENPFE